MFNHKPLFSILLNSHEKTLLSDALRINSHILNSEAYLNKQGEDSISELQLKFENEDIYDKWILYQNQPNPFNNLTLITFNNPNSEYVTLKIMDYSGKVIETKSGFYEKGKNTFEIDWTDQAQTGVFIYQLESKSFISSKKMVRTP